MCNVDGKTITLLLYQNALNKYAKILQKIYFVFKKQVLT